VFNSLVFGAVKVGMNITIGVPANYEPKSEIIEKATNDAKKINSKIEITNDPYEAVKDADIIYTDVWTSMGFEEEKETRKNSFKPFQVNKTLVDNAKRRCDYITLSPCAPGEKR